MSNQGVVIIDLLALGFVLWLLNLVRTKRLNVSHAAIWILAVLGMMVLVTVPPFLHGLPQLIGATYPASALSLLAFVFIFAILIYFSVQLSQIARRQTELIQALAIRGLLDSEESAGKQQPAEHSPDR